MTVTYKPKAEIWSTQFGFQPVIVWYFDHRTRYDPQPTEQLARDLLRDALQQMGHPRIQAVLR